MRQPSDLPFLMPMSCRSSASRSITREATASINKDRDSGPARLGVPQAYSADKGSQYIHKRIDRFVRPPEVLDLFDGVENRRVVPAVIKSADLRQTPSAHAHR